MRSAVCIFVAVASTLAHAARAEPPITALALAPGEREVVLGSQMGITIRSWPALEPVSTLRTTLVHVHDLAFSPDGKTLLAAGGAPGESGVVEVWNWADRTRTRQVSDHSDLVYRVAWSPDGTRWASASGDGSCLVHPASPGSAPVRFTGHSRAVLALAFLDDDRIASAGVDQTARLWNARTGKAERVLDNHLDTVNAVVVRPGGSSTPATVLATIGEDRTARLWQPRIGRLMRFANSRVVPRALAWSADGGRLFVGGNDGNVRVIDPDTMEVGRAITAGVGRIHELLATSDPARLVVAGESGCRAVPVP